MASTPFKRKLSSASSPSPKRSRNELDLKRKIELIKQYDSIPKPTQKDLAKSFNVGTLTVSDILKKKENIQSSLAKMHLTNASGLTVGNLVT